MATPTTAPAPANDGTKAPSIPDSQLRESELLTRAHEPGFALLPPEILARVVYFLILAGEDADAAVGVDDNVSLIYARKAVRGRDMSACREIAALKATQGTSGIDWLSSGHKVLRWAEYMSWNQRAASLRHLVATPLRTNAMTVLQWMSIISLQLPTFRSLTTLEMSVHSDTADSMLVVLRAIGRARRLRRLALSGVYPARRGEAVGTTSLKLSELTLALEAGGTAGGHSGGTAGGRSGLRVLVLDNMVLSQVPGERHLPALTSLEELRLVDVADGDWASVAKLTRACGSLKTLEWTVCNVSLPADEVTMEAVIEAIRGRLALRTLIVGRNFAETARESFRAANRSVMDKIVRELDYDGQLKHFHLGHPSLIEPGDLRKLGLHLQELSVDMKVFAYSSSLHTPSLLAFAAALSSIVPSLLWLTVTGAADAELRDFLTVRLRCRAP